MRSLIAIDVMLAASLFGQAPATRPAFEVASVKPGGDEFSTRAERSGGRVRWTTELCYLIGYAYHLDFSHVWGRNCGAVYSVDATFDPEATDDQVRLMVQSLLADRFKLQAHRVSKEADGYAFLIGKSGLKIREVKTDEESHIAGFLPDAGVVAVVAHRASMAQLAQTLEHAIQAPVWDRTGLSGNFSFDFRFRQDLTDDSKSDAPSIERALQETLGIKLEKQKGPVEGLVIDSIGEPGDN